MKKLLFITIIGMLTVSSAFARKQVDHSGSSSCSKDGKTRNGVDADSHEANGWTCTSMAKQ